MSNHTGSAKKPSPPMPAANDLGTVLLACFIGIVVGLMITLSATNVIPTSDSKFGAPRLVVALIGITALVASSTVFCRFCRGALAVKYPGLPFPFAALKALYARITRNSLLAGAAVAVPFAEFALAWRFQILPLFATYDDLYNVITIEFLVIHSTPFLGLLICFRPDTKNQKIARTVALAGFLALYGAIAVGHGSLLSAFTFIYLSASKFWAGYLQPPETSVRWLFGARWLIQGLLFMVVAAIANPSLRGAGNLPLGTFYFALVLVFEVFCLYPRKWPGHLKAT